MSQPSTTTSSIYMLDQHTTTPISSHNITDSQVSSPWSPLHRQKLMHNTSITPLKLTHHILIQVKQFIHTIMCSSHVIANYTHRSAEYILLHYQPPTCTSKPYSTFFPIHKLVKHLIQSVSNSHSHSQLIYRLTLIPVRSDHHTITLLPQHRITNICSNPIESIPYQC